VRGIHLIKCPVLSLGFCAVAAASSAAQSSSVVRGQVLLPDSTRAQGIIVTASDTLGAVAARALSGTLGEFRLVLPHSGTYLVRALRVGYHPTLTPAIEVASGTERMLRIVLEDKPVVLSAVMVRGDNACRIRPDSGHMVARLWEEARKVLTATQLSSTSHTLVARVAVYERTMDVADTHLLGERTSVREGPSDRPFAAVSPDSLARFGYVREQADGSMVYDAPDADVLLSDRFAATHCFHAAPGGQHTDWAGVAFRPARERNGVNDIEGTLWIDRTTAELRRLEFAYTNLDADVRTLEAGGSVDFLRLPTGQWIVNRWVIRMPLVHYLTQTSFRDARPGGSTRRLVVDGVQHSGGDVVAISRQGVELYRVDDRGPTVLQPPPPAIVGQLYDSLSGLPLQFATVHLVDPPRQTRSDSAGRFRFDSVLPGKRSIRLEHPRLDSLGLQPVIAEVDVRPTGETIAFLAAASFGMLWRRECASSRAPSADSGLVYGRVVRAAGVPVDSAALAEVSWGERRRARTDAVFLGARSPLASNGRFALCGVPAHERISLRASQGTLSTPTIALLIGESRVAVRDLTLTDPAAMRLLAFAGADVDPESLATTGTLARGGSVLTGSITEVGGQPISDARVAVSGVDGAVTTDASGHFALQAIPQGRRRISVRKVGFVPVQTVADVYPSDSVILDMSLTRVTTLAAVTVSDRQRKRAAVEEIRERIRGAPGRFVDSTALAKLPSLSLAFQGPAVSIRVNSAGGWTVQVNKQSLNQEPTKLNPYAGPRKELTMACDPAIFIDGLQANEQDLSDMDKNRVAVTEFYLRGGSTPLEYMVNACGTILVWTKEFVRIP